MNKKYYVNKGYTYTKIGDKFIVKAEDLAPSNKTHVYVECGYCHKIYQKQYATRIKSSGGKNFDVCKSCGGKASALSSLQRRRDSIYKRIKEFCDSKNYTVLTQKDEIINQESIIRFVCPLHGEMSKQATYLIAGRGCYDCGRISAGMKIRGIPSKTNHNSSLIRRQTTLYKKVKDKCDENGYELITAQDEILNNRSRIVYICPQHGVHDMRVNNMIFGRHCPDCAIEESKKRYKLHPDEVERRIEEFGGVLTNKEDYINNTTKNLRVLCGNCGEPFLTSLRSYTQHGGQLCSNCSKKTSIGEHKISEYLSDRRIEHKREFWFDDCRDQNPLPFDFYIPSMNTIIEFDGRQHYEETELFHSALKEVQYHDSIKNSYCKSNGINLIRIPYWNINEIETILDKELNINSHEDIV